jgi:predicted ferric reductase
MTIGLLSAFTGLLYLPLAQVIAWVVWLLTTCLLLVARVFSALPYACFEIQGPAVLIIAGYYILLMLAAIRLNRRRRMRFMTEMEIA